MNPGVARAAQQEAAIVSRLLGKAARSQEHRRKIFVANFEARGARRKKLFARLRPKLEPGARASIEKFKEELRVQEAERRRKLAVRSLGLRGLDSQASPDTHHTWEKHPATAVNHTGDMGYDLSRRSSLKSSVMDLNQSRSGSPGPGFTENPLQALRRESKPEVVVTKAKRKVPSPSPSPRDSAVPGGSRGPMAFMSLMPAPTPTRFIGMMHKVKMDSTAKAKNRKSENGARSKPSSRRSSVAPSTRTIEETAEVDSPTSPRPKEKVAAGFPTALRMVGKAKMDIAGRLKSVAKERRDSVKSDAASTTSTSPTSAPAAKPRTAPSPSPTPSRKGASSSSSSRKAAFGLVALKKGALGGKKKKDQGDESATSTAREMKVRLFFKPRSELSDEEVLGSIGRESCLKELGQGLDEIVNAASMMKKLMKDKVGRQHTERGHEAKKR